MKRRPIRRRSAKLLDNEKLAPSPYDQEVPMVVRPWRARQMLDDLPESTFYKLVKAGEFEVVRIGHITWLTTKSVRAFLARHTAA